MNRACLLIAIVLVMSACAKNNEISNTDGVNIEKLAQNKTPEEINEQGVAILKSGKTQKDYVKALELFKVAADKGLPEAQNNLGLMYAHGKGQPQNNAEAVHWFAVAAESNHAPAMSNLGTMVLAGLGVERDESRAKALFEQAAELGSPIAQNNLGIMYRDGIAVAESPKQAARYFQEAVAQNYTLAYINLAELYSTGTGVEQDHSRAITLLQEAAALGDPQAQERLTEQPFATGQAGSAVESHPPDQESVQQIPSDDANDDANDHSIPPPNAKTPIEQSFSETSGVATETNPDSHHPCRLRGEIIMASPSACTSMAGVPLR